MSSLDAAVSAAHPLCTFPQSPTRTFDPDLDVWAQIERTPFEAHWQQFVDVRNAYEFCEAVRDVLWWDANGNTVIGAAVLAGMIVAGLILAAVLWLVWKRRRRIAHAADNAVVAGLASGVRAGRVIRRGAQGYAQRARERADS